MAIPTLLLLLILLLLSLLLLTRVLFRDAVNNTSEALLLGNLNWQKIERKEKTVEYLRMREQIEKGEICEGMSFEQFSNVWVSNLSPCINNGEIDPESGFEAKFEYFSWDSVSGDSLGTIVLNFEKRILKKIQIVALPGLEGADDTGGAVDSKA